MRARFPLAGGAHLPAVRAPAAAVGDPPDLLHVHVHQLTGPVAFVAHRGGLGRADRLPGQRVTLGQPRHPAPAQDPGHGARLHPQLGAEPIGPAPVFTAGGQHPLLDLRAGAGRLPVRPRGPVVQPVLALLSVPDDPLDHALA
jgi:hypothetical protein